MTDDQELTEEEIEELQNIKEQNSEAGANRYTMDTDDEEDED